jgi:CAAX protease family protein
MESIKNGKAYIIDPEPLMPLGRALILLSFVFIVSTLSIGILNKFLDVFWISLIVEVCLYMVPIIILAIYLRYPINDILRLKNMLRIDLNLILIFGTVFMVIISSKLAQIVQQYLPLSKIQIEWKHALIQPGEGIPFIFVFISSAIITGFCEEILFRGVIQPSLIKKNGSFAGIVVTALLFAAFHVNLQDFISLFILGIFLGILAYRGGTFMYAALAHIIFNGIAVSGAALNQNGGVGFQDGGISFTSISTITILFIVLMVILFRLTHRRVIGEPEMYHI